MNSKLRKAVFFILLIGINYIGYQFMIKPANKGLIEQRNRVNAKLVRLVEFERACAAAEGLNKQLIELQKCIDSLESKLPLTSEIHKVLEQVTLIAQKEGLKAKDIRTLKQKENNGYIDQPMKMELVGNFNSFYSFMLELEQLSRIMKIRELEIKKDLTNEGDVYANFVVSIFFQKKT